MCAHMNAEVILCHTVVTHILIYAVVIHNTSSLGIKVEKDCVIFIDSMKLNAHL